jgi:hypothetical protein
MTPGQERDLRQRYCEGTEDQLLVVNALVRWNTRYR